MDIVFIRGLQIETRIGIHEWEKQRPRPVVLDLELASDIARAAASDRIEDALDYDAIIQPPERLRLREPLRAGRDPGGALRRDPGRRVRRALAAADAEQVGRDR